MKLLIVLSVIACGYAAKLDRTYLPPANAGTSGGSPGSLNTPLGPSGFGQPAGFGQARPNAAFNGAAGNSPALSQSGNNGFSAPSNQYIQPGQAVGPNFDAGFGVPAQNFGNQAQDYQRSQPQRAQSSADQNAQILRSDSQNDGESFSYSFETSNGISAEESGVATNGVQAQGAFAYSSDDGQSFRVQYTADENGYQPQGDHLPTSPPIPDEILKSIEENARAAASGTQEGAYNPNEDNEVSQQQYSNNAPTSYNQASTGNQAGPAQLYGAPNAGSRPQSQAFSQGPQATQYNAGPQNGGSSRPSNGFSQSQSPSQVYGSPSSAGNGASNSFEQRPSKYSAGPSAANFGPSGPQARPQQYQASPSSQFPSAGRPQGSAQAQDASGYQYNKPQGGFGGNVNAPQQYRPQNGAASGVQGFSRPNGNSFPSSSSNGQGSFGASPNSQGSYSSAPNSQSSFTPSGPKGPSSFGASPNSQGSYGSVPTSQGSFTPSGSKGPSSFGSNGQTSYGARPNSAGPSSGSQSFGPSSNGFNRPQAGPNGFRPQGQTPGAKNSMSGYEYNKPGGSQFGNSPQISGSSQVGGSPQFGGSSQVGSPQFGGSSQFGGSPQVGGSSQVGGSPQFGGAQTGFKSNQGPAQFGAPRNPPSFSEEEGYKY